jgi:hypothetical protein
MFLLQRVPGLISLCLRIVVHDPKQRQALQLTPIITSKTETICQKSKVNGHRKPHGSSVRATLRAAIIWSIKGIYLIVF